MDCWGLPSKDQYHSQEYRKRLHKYNLQNIVIFQSDRGKDILKECVEKQGLFLVAGCGS